MAPKAPQRDVSRAPGFIDKMGLVLDKTANTMKATPVTVMSNDNDPMMWVHFTSGRPDGRTYESHHAYLYRFRNGELYESHTVPSEQAVFEAFMTD